MAFSWTIILVFETLLMQTKQTNDEENIYALPHAVCSSGIHCARLRDYQR